MKITIDTELLTKHLQFFDVGEIRCNQALAILEEIANGECKKPFVVKREGVRKPKNAGYSPEFEQFWAAYPSCPNKTAKGTAWKEWEKLCKELGKQWNESPYNAGIALHILIEAALKWQKQSDKWKQENGKYICKPENYLKGRMFEDEPPIKTKKETYMDINGEIKER